MQSILCHLMKNLIISGIRNKISQSEAVELVLNATSNKIPLFLVRDMEGNIIHIDTTDKGTVNWPIYL